jgi:predicted methyltransferase
MPPIYNKSLFLLAFSMLFYAFNMETDADVFQFKFKGKRVELQHYASIKLDRDNFYAFSKDTISNIYFQGENYIEIIRQDNDENPRLGIALGFEFDENNGEYPYTPARAVAQLKDFAYGGVQFDQRDTCNYTAVSNEVSDDITIEIDDFKNDTIFGRFSGLLLNGAGKMAAIEEGQFKIHLVRVN